MRKAKTYPLWALIFCLSALLVLSPLFAISRNESVADWPKATPGNIEWQTELINDLPYYYTYLGEYPQTYVGGELNATLQRAVEDGSSDAVLTGNTYRIYTPWRMWYDETYFTDYPEYYYNGERYVMVGNFGRDDRLNDSMWGYLDNCVGVRDAIFHNGEPLTDEFPFFFRVEPIKWFVFDGTNPLLLTQNTEIKLISNLALSMSHFYFGADHEPNGWEESDLRAWASTYFFTQSGLWDLKDDVIRLESVANNDPYGEILDDSTGKVTHDYVYIPSLMEQDYIEQSYTVDEKYFQSQDVNKQVSPSDFAILGGAQQSHKDQSNYANYVTNAWTRTCEKDKVYDNTWEFKAPQCADFGAESAPFGFRPEITVNYKYGASSSVVEWNKAIYNDTEYYYTYRGEYPQTYVGDNLSRTFENMIHDYDPSDPNSPLQLTGKTYATNDKYFEYSFQNKIKYVRVERPNYDSSFDYYNYSNGDYGYDVCWFMVEPIKWWVVDVNVASPFEQPTDATITVISDVALTASIPFSNSKNGEWEDSAIRGWIQSYFLKESGLEGDPAVYKQYVDNNSVDNPSVNGYGKSTEDYVYLPSIDEMIDFSNILPNRNNRAIATPSDFALANNAYISNGYATCWSRSVADAANSYSYRYNVLFQNKVATPITETNVAFCPEMTLLCTETTKNKVISWSKDSFDGENYHYFTYRGEYPQTFVGNEMDDLLEGYYKDFIMNGNTDVEEYVVPTGKKYVTYDDGETGNNGVFYEYWFKGSRYVRVENPINPNGISFSNNESFGHSMSYAWFKVEPIKWYIVDDTNPFEVLQPTDIRVMAANTLVGFIPYFESTDDHSTYSWQNSYVRSWINSNFMQESGLSLFNNVAIINKVALTNSGCNSVSGSLSETQTEDYVYIPTYQELVDYCGLNSGDSQYYLEEGAHYGAMTSSDFAAAIYGSYANIMLREIDWDGYKVFMQALHYFGREDYYLADTNDMGSASFVPFMTLSYDPEVYATLDDMISYDPADPDIYSAADGLHIKSYKGLQLLSDYTNASEDHRLNRFIYLDNNIVFPNSIPMKSITNVDSVLLDGQGWSICNLSTIGGLFGQVNNDLTLCNVNIIGFSAVAAEGVGNYDDPVDLQNTAGLITSVEMAGLVMLDKVLVEMNHIEGTYAGVIGMVDANTIISFSQVEVYFGTVTAPNFTPLFNNIENAGALSFSNSSIVYGDNMIDWSDAHIYTLDTLITIYDADPDSINGLLIFGGKILEGGYGPSGMLFGELDISLWACDVYSGYFMGGKGLPKLRWNLIIGSMFDETEKIYSILENLGVELFM